MRTRKILRALQVLAAVHLVAWTAAPLQAQTPPAAPTQESVADFDLPAKPLNPYFLGVNTAFFNRPYDYTNPEVIRLTKDLNLQTIRTGSTGKPELSLPMISCCNAEFPPKRWHTTDPPPFRVL
jgi:hypothetical protein